MLISRQLRPSRRSVFWRLLSAISIVSYAAAFSLVAPVRSAESFPLSDGTQISCRAVGGSIAREISLPFNPSGYTGVTQVLPGGAAVIMWDVLKLNSLPSYAHDFIYFHECAHAHVPTSDELAANCVGLIDMRAAGRSSPAIEGQLAAFHTALGFMGPRYGVGADYWARTVACANQTGSGSAYPTQYSSGGTPGQLSLTCRFSQGPRSGQTQSYAGVAGVTSVPVGSPCTDGQGSFGTAIADGSAPNPQDPNGSQTAGTGGMSLTCQFNSGSRAGQTQNFSGVPGARPAPVGSPCTDGQGSYGIAVADGSASSSTAQPTYPNPYGGQNPGGALPQGMTLTCQFTSGPRAGQTQNFAGVPGARPAPIGSPCTDGVSSNGVAVAN